ncbi:MAG: RNA polymerase sigma-70 factor (ECF subfamily) [Planctomycetota bacterium]|jgi:RNA polymerase sigma-70 factor (ECF subfamily)
MKGENHKNGPSDLLDDLNWARELAVKLVGEAYADDVLQETRLAAWRFESGTPPRAWLRVVLKRFALQVMRSEGSRKRRQEAVAQEETLPSPAELSTRLEQQQALGRAISSLNEPYRSTILLRYSEGLEPIEIAHRLGIPAGTVRWRLKSALDQLRLIFDEDCGDRSLWMAAMVPLLRTPSSLPLPLSLPGVELAAGSLLMKKIIAVISLAALVGLGVYEIRRDVAPPLQDELTLQSNQDLTAVGLSSEKTVELHDRRKLIAIEEAANPLTKDEELQTIDEGWWLVGRVRGIPVGETQRTELLIRGSGTAYHHELRGAVKEDGSVRVDLSAIFTAPNLLPQLLELTISHPGMISAEKTWGVLKEHRQAGFIPGKLALFEVDRELSASFSTIRGAVEIPEGYALEDLRVLLVPAQTETPNLCQAVVAGACDDAGRFTLACAEPGRFHVLVAHKQKLLFPNFVAVDAIEGATHIQAPLVLDEGAILEGVALMNGGTAGFELELEVTQQGLKPLYCPASAGLTWFDGEYRYSKSGGATNASGEIRFTGLAPGKHRIYLRGLKYEGVSARITTEPALDLAAYSNSPTSSAVLNFEFHCKLYECLTGQQSLPYVQIVRRFDSGSNRTTADHNGRIAVGYAVEGPETTIEFSLEGYETVKAVLERDFVTPNWEAVHLLAHASEGASLSVDLVGDAERRMERFSVRFIGEGHTPGSDQTEDESWMETQWKRTGKTVRIDGIRPGTYQVIIAAEDPTSGPGDLYPDTACTILSEVRELTFAPGEERSLRIQLRAGGRLELQPICPDGDCAGRKGRVEFRILDSLGEAIPVHWVSRSGPTEHGLIYGSLPSRTVTFMEPPLAAGSYEIEYWKEGGELNSLRTRFLIAEGQTTKLRLEDPR